MQSKLIYKIIMLNSWNEKEQRMEVSESDYVRLSIGHEKDGVLQYCTAKDIQQ